MSQALFIKGTYKNNKTNSIGCYNPANNRFFTQEEIIHMHNMYQQHFVSNLSKFKKIEVFAHVEGKEVFQRKINAVDPLIITKLIQEVINKTKYHDLK